MTTAPAAPADAARPPTPADHPTNRAYRDWQEQSRLLERLQVVFVVGPPKSGTTWVQQTLAAHPEAAVEGEGQFATWLAYPIAQVFGQYTARQNQASRSGKETAWVDQADQFFTLRQVCDRVLIGYLRRAQQRGRSRLRAVIDKTPGHARHVATLANLYPWARFVCCTRDVRDAAVSAWHHLGKVPGFFEGAADIHAAAPLYAEKHYGELMRHARHGGAALGRQRYMELAYEDYKADPAATVRRLFAFCNLPADDALVTAAVESNTFERRSGGRKPGEEADSFHRKGVVGDWRNYFSEEEGARLVELAERRMAMAVQG
jgi:hypothetical protein